MQTLKDLMIEHDCTYDEAQEMFIEQEAAAFDNWKDRAKENGTYHNPLVRRDEM